MSKSITHLVLDIDLSSYSEDARFTIAKHLINRAVNSGILAEDDSAIFMVDPDIPKLIKEELEAFLFKVKDIVLHR